MSNVNFNGGEFAVHESLLRKNGSTAVYQCRKSSVSSREGEAFDVSDDLSIESQASRRARKNSHYVIYFTTFIMSVGFSIVLTGVWPYLKQLDPTTTKEFLGWVIAANPIGQIIFAPFIGWWTTKYGSVRSSFIFTMVLSIIGSAMYALLPLMPNYPRHLIFVARLIVGLSGANVAICRSYIVSTTSMVERTSALAAVAASQASGFIIGPVIQSAIIYAFEQASDGVTKEEQFDSMFVEGVPWNMYSAVGYIGVLLSLFNLVLFLFPCIFKDQSLGLRTSNTNNSKHLVKPDYYMMVLLLFAFFILQVLFAFLSSLLVPFALDFYAYDHQTAVFEAGIALSVLGAISFIVFIIVAVVSKKLNNDKRLFLFFGIIPMTIGIWLHFPVGSNYPLIKDCELVAQNSTFKLIQDVNGTISNITCNSLGCPPTQEWCYYTPIIEKSQLIGAEIITFIGYAVAFSLVPALFSKMIGPTPQGVWMGVLTSIGGFSRISGPLFAIYIYTSLGPRWLFGLIGGFITILSATLLVFYKRLVPYKIV